MARASDPSSRQQAERRGRRAEAIALLYLRAKGYRLLARRFKTPVGEIDLIVRRGGTIAFVEVKRRAGGEDAALSITPAGQRRIARAAEAWLARHPAALGSTLRFDAVLVGPRRLPIHLSGAFEAPTPR